MTGKEGQSNETQAAKGALGPRSKNKRRAMRSQLQGKMNGKQVRENGRKGNSKQSKENQRE